MSNVQTPNRIRVSLDKTIYCSSAITREVRHLCMRLENNLMVPLKGATDELHQKLTDLCREDPEQFMAGSRRILLPHQHNTYRRL